MKKVLSKMKRVFALLGAFIFSICTNTVKAFEAQVLYGPPPQYLYGPPPMERTSLLLRLWELIRNFFIPIIFMVGLLIYFKKSKKSTKRKVINTIIIVLITILIYCIINYIITGDFFIF